MISSRRDPMPLTQVLPALAELRGSDRIYTFRDYDPGAPTGRERSLTCADLDRRVRAVAGRLEALGARGERVLLLFSPGLESIVAFLGCLAAGAVAVPAYPPDPTRPRRTATRIASIAGDADPRAVLTTAAARAATPAIEALSAALWLVIEEVDDDDPPPLGPPPPADALAFIQYTSGSTGSPRGVMVGHDNLLANQRAIERSLATDASTRLVSWLPMYHDMGLVGNVLHTLYLGAHCTFLDPAAFLERPVRWLEAMTETGADVSMAPDFAYDLCCGRISEADKRSLDLSRWRVAVNGAEPVRAATIDRFAAVFGECGFDRDAFYPSYGLAEAVVGVASGGGASRVEGRVASGRPMVGFDVRIVDPDRRVVRPEGIEGEIWLAGPSVARGYWGRPDETRATFAARLADSSEGPFLRTGDLGFRRGPELFVTGRLKDVVIRRGINHHAADIERTIERSHPALRAGCGAVFSVEAGPAEQLVAVHEVRATDGTAFDEAEIVRLARQAVAADHDLRLDRLVLVGPGDLPKTANGKKRRAACREAYRDGRLGGAAEPGRPAAPEELERRVRVEVAAVLGLGRPGDVEASRRLTELGMDLERSIALARRLGNGLGLPLAPTLAFDHPTIEGLVDHLTAAGSAR